MVFENKLKLMYEENDDVIDVRLDAIESVAKVLHEQVEKLHSSESLDQYDIYEHALKTVTSFPSNKS